MEALTVTLFERIGLWLVFAFMMTRIPSFRYLLDRELDLKTILLHSMIFGIFGIAGAQAGITIADGEIISKLLIFRLEEGETLVGSTLVAVVIAGLMGGPLVGLGSGFIVAGYLYFLGGEGVIANTLVHPLSGLFAGFTARFFSQERVIAPAKALFIGMFTPILHMALILIFTSNPDDTIQLVNTIGLPLVITNSVAIAIFTAMIQVALNEKEQEAALETKRALKIAEEALPHLRQGYNFQTAMKIAQLLRNELKIAAVSLTNKKEVLAHIGLGADHHQQGEPLKTFLSDKALETGEIQIAYDREQIHCQYLECQLQAAIIVPIRQSGEVAGLIKLYFRRSQQIRAVEIALAQGLGKLISNQLDVVAAEKMKALIQEAELRNLQAQINPHFLFNTLHSIATLIRVNPTLARHLIVQLGFFMRSNLKLTSTSFIRLEQELKQLHAYLEIMKVRFSDKLKVNYLIADGLEEVLIPPFTLQPLVENSIQHGLRDMECGGEIQIHLKRMENVVQIEICDNGTGIPEHLLKQLGKHPLDSKKGSGIGLYNVNQRLTSLLGEKASLHFRNVPSGGCSVSFQIPVSFEREEEEIA
ncbi:histidine kinase [Microaerobacter geothermalis]|uniref:LytS/YhcK type 5TM receptor domain-containing protein n=1 Tax=Microaerobacter geothermalis TaxID=674972 RepID=UPI001F2F446D|nr:LytS/YhcK type 5TM receptor domain-containing protein [Microaerobacter geothermalis]MCF6094977.1 histidine kinase [Microaerobacter geothermalis]